MKFERRRCLTGKTYSIGWLQALAQDPAPKILAAAVAITLEAFLQVFNTVFMAVLVLWALDFVSGVVIVHKTGREFDWSRAMDGIIKLFLYIIVAATASMAGLVVAETLSFDPTDYFLSGAYMVIAWSEVVSIFENVKEAQPGLAKAFDRILQFRR